MVAGWDSTHLCQGLGGVDYVVVVLPFLRGRASALAASVIRGVTRFPHLDLVLLGKLGVKVFLEFFHFQSVVVDVRVNHGGSESVGVL